MTKKIFRFLLGLFIYGMIAMIAWQVINTLRNSDWF